MNTKRILVIDDEPSITRSIKTNLEHAGPYTVCTENDALFAVASARQFRPDLIFLDVMMPGMDGGAIAEQFKSDPYLQRIPVIFLTAIVTRDETGENGRPIGGQTFIAKPADLATLMMCIKRHIGGQEEQI